MLSLHIVNGALPSVSVGNFLRNATSGELGFAGNISTIDTIVLDITAVFFSGPLGGEISPPRF